MLSNIFQLNRSCVDTLVEMEKSCFGASAWSKQMLLDAFDSDIICFYGIQYDDKVIAYTCISVACEEAELLNIAVLSPYRRKGLGQRLLEYAIICSKSKGAEKMFLEVNVCNNSAIKMYRNNSFEAVGIRKNYYPIGDYESRDAYVMVKELSFDCKI